MSRPDSAETERLLRDLEQRVQQYPFRTVRITGSRDELLGLFLLSKDVRLAEGELQTALAGVIRREPAAAETGGAWSAGEIEGGNLEEVLASQIEHTRQTRLPCALILLETDAPAGAPAGMPAAIVDLVRAAVRRSDILLRCDAGRLAVILPSISLREATECAERIRSVLARELRLGEDDAPAVTASIGIGLCYASDRISAETFAARVAQELERARQQGGNRVCRVIDSRAESSCQVSVEERTELFSIFLKDRHS
ncbi:MAG: GGDEF domain-containing protein [Desulfobacteraceae bacterium]|nr:GGDEF domain-containing protein [Desulfobacteraceae bacterium]